MSRTHRSRHLPIYRVWTAIKDRCLRSSSQRFIDYGARGITICPEWINDAEAFIKWAMSNGYKKGLQIDRIDNNGNYTPSNCRFVTRKANGNNKRNNRWLTYNGQTKNITQWSEITGKSFGVIWHRLKKGWTVEDALTVGKVHFNGWQKNPYINKE